MNRRGASGARGTWTGRLRQRRGAILVMSALFMLVLMMMAGIAIDLSQLFVLRNELRTAADAAALAGAARIYSKPAGAEARARAMSDENLVAGSKATVDNIEFGMWDPWAKTFTVVKSAFSADAMRVTLSHDANLRFAPLFGLSKRFATTTAIGWAAAPVNEVTCGKPWSMTYEDFMSNLGKAPWDTLTAADMRELSDTTGGHKHYMYLKQGAGVTPAIPGFYGAVVMPPINKGGEYDDGGKGTAGYRDNIPRCFTVNPGDSLFIKKGNMVGPTVAGADDMCHPLFNDKCYNETGGIGVPVGIAIYKAVDDVDGDILHVRIVGTFMMTEIMSSGVDQGAVKGFFYVQESTGGIVSSTRKSSVTRTILVQ